MEFMFLPLKRYAEFSGRSRRMEYWLYQLMLFLLGVVFFTIMLVIGFGAMGLASNSSANGAANGLIGMFASMGIMFIVAIIIGLALFIPTLAVQVRRLHDSDRSGWWVMLYYGPYLLSLLFNVVAIGAAGQGGDASLAIAAISGIISLLFFGGWITLAVFDCLPGTPGPNRYGPDPLGGTQDLSRTFQ